VTKALALLIVFSTATAAGCGTSERPSAAAQKRDNVRMCQGTQVRGFRTCLSDPFPTEPTIERLTGSGWKVVAAPLPHPEPAASWQVVSLSPDRSTLLAEWDYPCDSAAVVFVPVGGGSPRLATGEKDWRQAPVASALGWTSEGKARVRIYTKWRGHRVTPMHPRTVLIDPGAPPVDAHPAPLTGC